MRKFSKVNESVDFRSVLQKSFNAMDGVKASVNSTDKDGVEIIKINLKFSEQLASSKVATIFGNLTDALIIDIKYLEKANKMQITAKVKNRNL